MARLLAAATLVVLLTGASRILAGVDITAWNLSTFIIQEADPFPLTDNVDILAIVNPLLETSTAQVNSSFSTAIYNYAWTPSLAIGHFETSVTHAIRAPESRAVSTALIRFFPTEDVRVTISGTAQYSHTPGDLSSIHFGGLLRTNDTGEIHLNEFTRGGNFYFEPSSGTLSYFNEVVLPAGVLYKYEYTVDTSNTADLLPTGIVDVSANILFDIAPIPEPSIALFALLATALALRRWR